MTLLALPLKVNLDRVQFKNEQFYQLCLSNPNLTIERDAEGSLIITPLLSLYEKIAHSEVLPQLDIDVGWVEGRNPTLAMVLLGFTTNKS